MGAVAIRAICAYKRRQANPLGTCLARLRARSCRVMESGVPKLAPLRRGAKVLWQFCVARAFLLHSSPASFELHAAVAALQNGSMSASAAAMIQRFLETAELYHPYASVEFCTRPWPVLCQECTT